MLGPGFYLGQTGQQLALICCPMPPSGLSRAENLRFTIFIAMLKLFESDRGVPCSGGALWAVHGDSWCAGQKRDSTSASRIQYCNNLFSTADGSPPIGTIGCITSSGHESSEDLVMCLATWYTSRKPDSNPRVHVGETCVA